MEKLRIADMPQFDMADYLETPEDIAHYLTAVLARRLPWSAPPARTLSPPPLAKS